MDEVRPHDLNKLTLSCQLMMNLLGQVAVKNAFVLKNSVASYCFVSFAFANTFILKVRETVTLWT